jgi:RHS repeat-associated protein
LRDGWGLKNVPDTNGLGIGVPYQFTGRQYDSETGLYYYRARYYNAEIGRFLQPDPIGYYDGMNLYTYAGNNPVVYTDPMGLSFSIGRVVESLGGFGIGFCESVYCAAKGTVNTVLHPIQTIQNIPAMIKAMPDIGRQFVDDITSPDAYRNGNAVGRLTGAVSATLVGAKVAEVGGNVVKTNLPKVREFVGKQTIPKGMGNPKVRETLGRGLQAHQEFAEKVRQKAGWQSETRIEGTRLRPDAIDPKGRPIELKPNTPSGRALGARQIEKYKAATHSNGRVIYYNP